MEVNGQLHAPIALLPRKQPHCIGGWMGPRAGLDAMEKRKICLGARNRIPISWSSIPQPSRYPGSEVMTYGTKMTVTHVEGHCSFLALYYNLPGGTLRSGQAVPRPKPANSLLEVAQCSSHMEDKHTIYQPCCPRASPSYIATNLNHAQGMAVRGFLLPEIIR
jgi:hypothetical protein